MTVAIATDGTRRHIAEVPGTLTFVEPPPGLPGLGTATLAPLDDTGYVFTLRGNGDAGPRLFLVSPGAYFPSYAPEVTDEVREALGSARGGATVPLAVVHPGEKGATTVNLLAPILVDPATGHAIQVVLDGDEWPLRAPIGG